MITAYGTSGSVTPVIYLFPPGGGDYETFAGAGSSSVTINHKLLLSGTYTIVIEITGGYRILGGIQRYIPRGVFHGCSVR